MWFTKHGAIDNQFIDDNDTVTLYLQGLGKKEGEYIKNGHFFPDDSKDINKLFEIHLTKAPGYYSKKIIRTGHLKNFPHITYQAIFCIEGKYIKYDYNKMISRQGFTPPDGAYTIQERYGIWLCKDYIPIQRKNEWITSKGSEYTKFHAFFNCQDLKLTANRGSIDNTPSEILQDIEYEVKKIYDSIISSEDWSAMEFLEEEAYSYQTTQKEKNNFEMRIKKINRSNICEYKGVTLVEPARESGVYSIFLLLSQLEKKLFPFYIIDYDTRDGIDVIVKGDNSTPIVNSKLFYVEFKKDLERNFNHSFENLHSVVCWETHIKHDDVIDDINKEQRKMQIIPPENSNDYTRYFLENSRKAHKIEVFVLKKYLKEKLKIEFHPRTINATV